MTFNLGRAYLNQNKKETKREAALRRRQKLIPSQGDFLEKEHLYDTSIAARQHEFRAMNENKRLKTQIQIMQQKLSKKDKLLQDSLNCTFIACPCTGSAKAPNMQLVFKLRKKVIELRDLCAL